MFRDHLYLYLKAGDGGRGCVSFLHEKFMPKGGPDGGDGGRGGDLIFVAKPDLNTLYHLSHQVHLRAPSGEPGQGKNCYGRGGRDLVIKVPVGTIIRDRETGVVLKDLVRADEPVILCKGGRGGRGNKTFAGPLNQIPLQFEEGQKGEERRVELELKLIADVGLVGLPNAGKSTLLSSMSDARPKIADYPFTTLIPQPGIVSGSGYRSFVMADLPGLIEGAHTGVGLGTVFLKHVERTRVLVHLVDLAPLSGPRPGAAWKVIRAELEQYSRQLAGKPEVVVGTKCDLPGWEKGAKELEKACGRKPIVISAATRQGLKELSRKLFAALDAAGAPAEEQVALPQAVKPMVTEAAPRPRAEDPVPVVRPGRARAAKTPSRKPVRKVRAGAVPARKKKSGRGKR